ncbi:MAG TPA: 6-phosphogluconolactonase [Jatrophihabitans sp.]|jgi:6-phosphogluconolactonase|nr:6-phosphogluconolactonase [Jatrophihabitans sp.]
MRPEPEVVIVESADRLAASSADRVVQTLGEALRERPVAHLVVTGGGILEQVLSALAAPQRRAAIEWRRVHVWWGDERYVPANSDERNDGPAWTKLFEHVDIDPAKLHRMPASDVGFGEDAEAAADSYAAELAAEAGAEDIPTFDVILLGVGPDGHCASLFPGHPALQEMTASVIAVHASPKPPPTRLSLTFRALDAANEVWFIAAGDGKADAVARAVGGAPREEVPSAGPRGRIRTLWLIDQDAASKLPAR